MFGKILEGMDVSDFGKLVNDLLEASFKDFDEKIKDTTESLKNAHENNVIEYNKKVYEHMVNASKNLYELAEAYRYWTQKGDEYKS